MIGLRVQQAECRLWRGDHEREQGSQRGEREKTAARTPDPNQGVNSADANEGKLTFSLGL